MTRRSVFGAAIAASTTAFCIARPPAALWPSLAELMADVRTGPGEQRTLRLAAAASAYLNTRTSVSLETVRNGIGLRLIAGEAAIDNASTSPLPVVAFAGAGRTSAPPGASVLLRTDAAAICVTCAAGSVRVEHGDDVAILRSGDQLRYSDAGVGPIERAELDVATAWRRGYLIFRDTPLDAVVGEVNRYYAGRIVLASRSLSERRVYGAFRTDHIDVIVAQITRLTGARLTHLPGGIALLT